MYVSLAMSGGASATTRQLNPHEVPHAAIATTRHIQLDDLLPDSIPIHIKEVLARGSIPYAILYEYDFEHGTDPPIRIHTS
jgi:hypothetical protein